MLRRIAPLFVLALLSVSPVSAQEARGPDDAGALPRADSARGFVSYGLKIGPSSTWFRSGSSTGVAYRNLDQGVLSAFAFGGFAELRPDTSGVSLQLELLFMPKGTGIALAAEEAGATDVKADLSLSYLEMPLMIEHPLRVGQAEGQFYSGGYLAYAVNSRLDVRDEEIISAGAAARLDALRERWDYGVVLGARIDLSMFGTTLTYDMRYDLGVARLGSDSLSARTGAFTLMFEAAF